LLQPLDFKGITIETIVDLPLDYTTSVTLSFCDISPHNSKKWPPVKTKNNAGCSYYL